MEFLELKNIISEVKNVLDEFIKKEQTIQNKGEQKMNFKDTTIETHRSRETRNLKINEYGALVTCGTKPEGGQSRKE